MPATSKVMMGFGLLLLACAAGAWMSEDPTLRAGVANGLAMIAAGAAAAQGRRSLRRTGYFIGFLLPALMLVIFTWRAVGQWKAHRSGGGPMSTALLLTILAAAAAVVVLALLKLRARYQSDIAERGYSLTTPAHVVAAAATDPPPEGADRS